MTPYEKLIASQKADQKRHYEALTLARKQGLVFVKFSKRRHMVIKIHDADSSIHRGTGGKLFTKLDGKLVFGPATYENCMEWICENSLPAPEELS